MKTRAYRATLFALYQCCIALGIVAMPLAIAVRQTGFTLPLNRLLEAVGAAYEDARAE